MQYGVRSEFEVIKLIEQSFLLVPRQVTLIVRPQLVLPRPRNILREV